MALGFSCNSKVAFIVSSVTAMAKEKKNKKKPDDSQGSQDPNPTQDDESGSSQESDRVLPGVAFWIACKTPSCMLRRLESLFINMFQSCGFDVYTCKVIRSDILEILHWYPN